MKVLFSLMVLGTVFTYNSAEAAACNDLRLAACYANALTASHMLAAVPVIQSLQSTFPDQGACEEWARSVRMMEDGGIEATVAVILARSCGECACRLAY